jgi:dTDP-glucose 4,6-dehydratase
MKKILVTGGCGFFGHHFIEHIFKNTDWQIVIFDKLSYASNGYDRLRDIEVYDDKRVRIFSVDLTLPISEGIVKEVGNIDYIYHIAANSHVDNSIASPTAFVTENVKSTLNILEYARIVKPELFINFSTDEVYGPAPKGKFFKEFEYHYPSNPYAASKSAQEAIGIAYSNTYKIPVITTHTMNLLGERQDPEKFVPLIIKKILNNDTIFIHSNSDRTKAGSRCYIHCRNVAAALLHLTLRGYHGYDEWNIAGEQEIDNLDLAQRIASIIGKPLKYEMVDFHSSRPGHDLRYALDSSKLFESGFSYPKNFNESFEKMIKWILSRPEWLK